MTEKDWSKITNELNNKVEKITSKYLSNNKINTIIKYSSENESIFQKIFKNKILTSIAVLIISFIILSCILYYIKPNFLTYEVKNEKTFFIEKKVNVKNLLGLSLFLSLIIAFLYFKYL